jgi:hypothetical protein
LLSQTRRCRCEDMAAANQVYVRAWAEGMGTSAEL